MFEALSDRSQSYLRDPTAEFIQSWNRLEQEIREVSWDKDPEKDAPFGLRDSMQLLQKRGFLSSESADEFFSLLAMRNDLVHGKRRFADRDILDAIMRVDLFRRELASRM